MKFCKLCFAIAVVMFLASCSDDKNLEEKIISKKIAPTPVAAVTTKPSQYVPHIVPEKMTVAEKKQRFSFLVAPAIDEVHRELMKQYEDVALSVAQGTDANLISTLKKEYKAKTNQELLTALKPHPQSIGLAQAAMESAWGTSRFFREANNIFGVWSFDKNEPRIAASQKRANKTIWVKKYPTIKASIKDYYRVLARGGAFKDFRALKMKTSDPYALVKKLDKYSEKGDEYGKELAAMIRYNKFYEYDK